MAGNERAVRQVPIPIRLRNKVPAPSDEYLGKFLVEHGLIKWSIENFSSFPKREGKFVMSPTFTLQDTWWYLTFYPMDKQLETDYITINIIREPTDPGPVKIAASFRLGLESGGNKVWFNSNEHYGFERGTGYGTKTCIFGHLEDFIVEGDRRNDTLLVLCEMYVSYLKPSETETLIHLTDLKHLTKDLCKILYHKRCTDVLIEISGFSIKAHKSVLCARSRTLAKMLDHGNSYLRFSCMSKSCLICLLLYIYSGTFDFLARSAVFSIGLYECACKLSLTGLVNLLAPTKIELKTQIIVKELEATWDIYKFSVEEIFNIRVFHGPHFCLPDSTDFSIQISICALPGVTDFISIDVEIYSTIRALDFSLSVWLLDRESRAIKTATAKFFKESGCVFTTSIFPVEDILSCIYDDTLVIRCTCERYSLRVMAGTSATLHSSFDGEDAWIEDLSDNLMNLYRAGTLSDVTLKAGDTEFKLHRSILSARSPILRRKFMYDQYKRKTLEIPDMEPYILELMVEYMYCGKMNRDLDLTDALSLYKVAGKYHLEHLETTCSSLVSSKFDNRNVFEVLSWAGQHNDLFMVNICMVCIAEYIRAPESSEHLRITT